MTDELFQRFYNAGMRKMDRKKALILFNRLLKKQDDPEAFTTKLVFDIQKRISVNQQGFDKLHPTTYLNGERWEDEIIQAETKQTPMQRLTDRTWANHMVNPQLTNDV